MSFPVLWSGLWVGASYRVNLIHPQLGQNCQRKITTNYERWTDTKSSDLSCLVAEIVVCALDVDECTASPPVCDVNAICNNIIGSHRCTCKAGFYGDGKTCAGNGASKHLDVSNNNIL